MFSPIHLAVHDLKRSCHLTAVILKIICLTQREMAHCADVPKSISYIAQKVIITSKGNPTL